MTEPPNVASVRPDGPIIVTGDLVVAAAPRAREMKTVMLCRCGRSKDKPFCDGMHVKIGFRDPARFAETVPTSVPAEAGRVTITPLPHGPNRCEGPLTIRDVNGRTAATHSALLCRCGGSRNKPFCDGTHKTLGFSG